MGKKYYARTVTGKIVELPDGVYHSQRDFDQCIIDVWHLDGRKALAILRGDLYGLHTGGTGDPVVSIIGGVRK